MFHGGLLNVHCCTLLYDKENMKPFSFGAYGKVNMNCIPQQEKSIHQLNLKRQKRRYFQIEKKCF